MQARLSKNTRIGPYIILESLKSGQGGMAQVFRARQDGDPVEVALKVSRQDYQDPRFNNALKQEVDILKNLRHPAIVQILPIPMESAKHEVYMARAVELPGKPWFYAMEYLAGGSLWLLIKKYGRLPFALACAIAERIAFALEYLHHNHVFHLDIKPDNILFRFIVEEHTPIDPVVIDFGVAARIKSLRPTGGSLHTMAPEQLKQARGILPPEMNLDMGKMDIYSLGVTTYRMWTGRYPFEGISANGVTNAVLNQIIQPPGRFAPHIPKQADELMLRWLDKNPSRRPDFAELHHYLHAWSEGLVNFPRLSHQGTAKAWWKFWAR